MLRSEQKQAPDAWTCHGHRELTFAVHSALPDVAS